MNNFFFLIRESLEDFKRNKVRTFLTSLGILIGVLSVILLMAFGYGLKEYINSQFESLGKNLIMVMPGQGIGSGGGRGIIGGAQFDEKDIVRLSKIKGVEQIAPIFVKTVKITAGSKSEFSSLAGTTSNVFQISAFKLGAGKPFTNADLQKMSKKVVIGATIAEKLFGTSENAIGKNVRIQNQRFIVSGVLKKQGGALGGQTDTQSIIPYKSAYSFNPTKKFFEIYIKAKDSADPAVVKSEVKKTLLRRYKEDDFNVSEQAELLSTINSIFSVINLVLLAIGSISLIVGGIGIMNIMYAMVTDRTKEVGIRRAIGATRADILVQFLTEAIILSVFGGLMGLFLAFVIITLIQPIFPAVINFASITAALGVSSFIGIFFGVFPAKRAASLSPIDAIRYE